MAVKEKGLGLDIDRVVARSMAILPDRDTYFRDMIGKLREKYDMVKLLYANNTTGQAIDPVHPNPDFVIIMQAKMVSSNRLEPSYNVILIDAPMLFTERSIAGWTLAVESKKMNAYLEYMMDKCLRISEKKFVEYIENMCLLSMDKDSPQYWRKPENSEKLVKEIMELFARYTGKNTNRMQSTRGYSEPQK